MSERPPLRAVALAFAGGLSACARSASPIDAAKSAPAGEPEGAVHTNVDAQAPDGATDARSAGEAPVGARDRRELRWLPDGSRVVVDGRWLFNPEQGLFRETSCSAGDAGAPCDTAGLSSPLISGPADLVRRKMGGVKRSCSSPRA
jgi:hypothetical protein